MIPLLLGIVVAVAALYYVLDPLFKAPSAGDIRIPLPSAPPPDEARGAIEALREIEFDRATGKLSDSDYSVLKARYTTAAVAAMREEENAPGRAGSPDIGGGDDVEALVARFRTAARACAECGPRPEPDAIYCSNCGRFIGGSCGRCGASPPESGARFCSSCGAQLAA